jgi:coenzyme F420-reducing hydrogenase beta subunit
MKKNEQPQELPRGRPPTDYAIKKMEMVTAYLNRAEKEKVQAKAAEMGITVSTLLRKLLEEKDYI